MQRIANGAIASNQLVLAHHTLEEAITATSQVTMPLVRDQRLIALVTSLTSLTDALLRDRPRESDRARAARGGAGRRPRAAAETARGHRADPDGPARVAARRLPGLDHRQPDLPQRDALRVAESEAIGSADHRQRLPADGRRIAGEPTGRPLAADPGRRREPATHATAPADRPTHRAQRAAGRQGEGDDFTKLADEILVDSWNVANADRPADLEEPGDGADRAVGVGFPAVSRGASSWPGRSRTPSPAPRPCCCWPRPSAANDQDEAATATYQAAAEAVASIPRTACAAS